MLIQSSVFLRLIGGRFFEYKLKLIKEFIKTADFT
jgi:hypothetical protein